MSSTRVSLNKWQQEAYDNVVTEWVEWKGEIPKTCGTIIQRGVLAGKPCRRPAGQGSYLLGYGKCVAHGGAKRQGRAYGAWIMAHQFAQELNVTPWEALLKVVRITAGRVAYCEQVLANAMSDDEIEGKVEVGADGRPAPLGMSADGEVVTGRNLSWWVDTSERERDRLAKVSKAAIDAGVAAMIVQQSAKEGEAIGTAMMRALDAMEAGGMPDEWLEVARRKMIDELRSMETSSFAQVDKVSGSKEIES